MKKAIYVEDDLDIQEITKMALDGEFHLFDFSNPIVALQKAAHLEADFLLLDVMMPGMDGPDLLKELRKFKHLETVPAIFMTAKVKTTEISSFLEIGAVGVIQKPFDPMTLSDEIHRILSS